MKILCIILFILISSVNISAQHKSKDRSCSNESCRCWNYRVTLGTWMTAMSGDVSANGLYGYIDNTFYNKYNGADFSFYGKFEAIKGRLSYSGQFASAYQSDKFVYDKDSLYSRSITTIRPMFISGDVSWQFYENTKSAFDIYGGIRMNIFTNLIENFYKQTGSVQEGQTKFFIDPKIGSGFYYTPFGDKKYSKFFVKGNFDVGGFGLVSFLSFESYLGAGYNLNKLLTLNLGYRYIDVHYGTDTYLMDSGLQGFELTASTFF